MKFSLHVYLTISLILHGFGSPVSAFTVTLSRIPTLRNRFGHGNTLAMSTTDTDRHEVNNKILDGEDDNAHGMPRITTINSTDDLFEFLAEDERLCVVKFYAKWCKSCAKFGLKMKQFAKANGDLYDDHDGALSHKGEVRFAEVEYSQNVRLCKTFGIKKLPYVQIYKAKHGRIDEFVCGPAVFNEKLVKRVEELMDMSDDQISFLKDMEDGQNLVDELASGNTTSAAGGLI